MQILLCSFSPLFLFLLPINVTTISGQDAASSHLSWNFLHNDTWEAEGNTASRLFKEFVKTHNKTYVNEPEEYGRRFIIFKESLKRHIQLNGREREKNGTAVYGINQFSDWTPQEFKEFLKRGSSKSQGLLAGCEIETLCCRKFELPSGPVPASQDWTKQGKVTAVKNQGKCGSCWAFTATECVETQWAIAGHPLTDLSVQELISCSKPSGCSGGITMCALAWLQSGQFTLAQASECPYVDKETTCPKSLLYEKGAKISCACYANRSEEKSMKPLVGLHGPLGVNVDATMWHDYLGGIIQHHCTDTDINHAVQITGYGFNGNIPYWIVRNSWGPSYGVNGYLYIKMGDNLCGVADSPSFVII